MNAAAITRSKSAVLLGCVVLAGLVGLLLLVLRPGPRSSHPGEAAAGWYPGGDRSGETHSPFTEVAERVLPAVVSVDVRRLFQHPVVEADSLDGFGWPFGPDGEVEIPSSGSGFLFDARGFVLTNAHVVESASEIRVHLADGRQLAARLTGADPATDIAVLKIEGDRPFPIVPLGNSDSLRIGEWVAAVGNPLGVLEGSVTVGVVSAKARNEISIGSSTPSYQDFIQTDAAINFGNSGGPLVNAHGQAIGVNTAFSGPGRGLGFAVSINLAQEVAKNLIESGRVRRGFLGVVLQRLEPALAEGLGLPDAHGVLVRDVSADSPAAQAGLLPGDAIVRFNEVAVVDLPSFRLQVARTPEGRRVPVDVYRDGRPQQLLVALSARPNLEGTAEAAPPADPTNDLGLDLAEPPDSADSDPTGVRVLGVQAGSVGSMSGILPDDLILEVAGTEVTSPEACLELLKARRQLGRPVVVAVRRAGERWYLAVPAER